MERNCDHYEISRSRGILGGERTPCASLPTRSPSQPHTVARKAGVLDPRKQLRERGTLRWREMDSNFRFPDAPSGRSAEARTFSSDREFAPLAWRDRDFEPPAPSRVDLCVRARTVSGT